MQELSLTVNRQRFNVRVSSRGHGPVVLFVHGWADDGRLWRYQAHELEAAGLRPICPDLLGSGRSDQAPLRRTRPLALAADLLVLLEELDVGPVHLVAHGFGSLVGWILVTARDDRFRSYATLSVGHPSVLHAARFETRRHELSALLTCVDRYRGRLVTSRMLRTLLRSHPDRRRIVEDHLRHPDKLRLITSLDVAHPFPPFARETLRDGAGALRVDVPTLGVYGLDDEFLWEEQLAESEAMVAAAWRYVAVQGAGHWLMLDRPEATTTLLLDWIERHEAEAEGTGGSGAAA